MAFSIAAWENQSLFVVPMLVLAERRITEEELDALQALLDGIADDATPDTARRFRKEFWRMIAKATRNPLFQQQVRWWSTLVAELDQRGGAAAVPGLKWEPAVYRRLLVALRARQGSAQVHLETLRPLLDWMEAAARDGAVR